MKILRNCARTALFFGAILLFGCGLVGESGKKDARLGLIVTPPSYYTTVRARYLGEKYKENLQRLVQRVVQNPVTGRLQFANNIASVGGMGFFTHSATRSIDERYLEVMLGAPDVFEEKADFNTKVDRLFSQYGYELLSILTGDSEIFKDAEVAGYGLNFSWRNTAQAPSGPRVTLERAVVYVVKGDSAKFLERQVSQSGLLKNAVIFALREDGPARMVSYIPQAGQESVQAGLQKETPEKGAEATPELSPKIQEQDLPSQKKEEKRSPPPVANLPGRDQPTKKQEEARRSEGAATRQEEAKRRQEAKLAEEARTREETAKRAEERKRQEEIKRAEETTRQEEAKRRQEAKLAEEARTREETAKRAEERKRQEEIKRAEALKQAEIKRQEEAKKKEEVAKRAEETKRQEEAKRAEAAKKKEAEQLALRTKQEPSISSPSKSPSTKERDPQSAAKGPAPKETKTEESGDSTAMLKPAPPPSGSTAAPKPTGSLYVVQFSFPGKEEAQRWFDRLRKEGYSASMSVAAEGEGVRLRVENFSSHEQASRVLAKLRGEGIKGIVIQVAN